MPSNSKADWPTAVYDELRRMADGVMNGERKQHTLQPTALANEVWLRLLKSRQAESLDHEAFLGVAAQAMRRILTDHARRRNASKRNSGGRRTTLSGKHPSVEPGGFAIEMNDALEALEATDSQLSRIVELRFYGANSSEDIARALNISVRTVKRRWRFARAWLQDYMEQQTR